MRIELRNQVTLSVTCNGSETSDRSCMIKELFNFSHLCPIISHLRQAAKRPVHTTLHALRQTLNGNSHVLSNPLVTTRSYLWSWNKNRNMKLTGTDLSLLADGRWYKAALKYQPYGHSLKKKHSSSNWLGPWISDKRWLTRAFRYNNDIMITKQIRIFDKSAFA